MKPIKLDYSKPRTGDVFLSHSNKPTGNLIEWAQTLRLPKNDRVPTHGGFIIQLEGQFLACEMKPLLVLNSLEKYTGRMEQIVSWYRPAIFDNPFTRQAMAAELMVTVRRNMEKYDPAGAALSSKLGYFLFGGFLKNDPKKNFCTEMVCQYLKHYGDSDISAALSPLDIEKYFLEYPTKYTPIGFKLREA